jgi:hypothetical protein
LVCVAGLLEHEFGRQLNHGIQLSVHIFDSVDAGMDDFF